MELRCTCGKLLAKQNENGFIEIKIKDKSVHICFVNGIIHCRNCNKIYIAQIFNGKTNFHEFKFDEDYYKRALSAWLN